MEDGSLLRSLAFALRSLLSHGIFSHLALDGYPPGAPLLLPLSLGGRNHQPQLFGIRFLLQIKLCFLLEFCKAPAAKS